MARLVDYNTVFRGLFDFGHHNRSFFPVGFMEGGEVCKRVIADDIGVQDEEWSIVFPQNFLCELERTRGAKGFGFNGESDFDIKSCFVL